MLRDRIELFFLYLLIIVIFGMIRVFPKIIPLGVVDIIESSSPDRIYEKVGGKDLEQSAKKFLSLEWKYNKF